MKKRRSAIDQPVNRAALAEELAAGYMFPDLFAQPDATPLQLISQEADDRPFAPQPIQPRLFVPPPIDYERIRQRAAQRHRARRRRR